jgi:hypothetical protein
MDKTLSYRRSKIMGRVFLERRYLEAFLEMHPEYQPKPGYITREGLVSFARWLIEQGYCKLGRKADEATIHVRKPKTFPSVETKPSPKPGKIEHLHRHNL